MTTDRPQPNGQPEIPSLREAIGGPVGMVESALPTLVFVGVITFNGRDIRQASIIAVAVAVVLALGRLARRQTLRFTVGGLIGVAFAAFVAAKSGKAENFFLPGLLINGAYATAFIVSILVSRPLTGYLISALRGGDPTAAWHRDARFAALARQTSWMWAGIFILKLAVQLPLYLGEHLVALGVARIAMGYPLYGLGIWVTWLMAREVPNPDLDHPGEATKNAP